MNFYQSRRHIPPSLASCILCPIKPECIRASALGQYDSKHPEKIRELVRQSIWRIRIETDEMKRGAEAHSILEEIRNVDCNISSIFRRLRSHERFFFTLSICSVRYGLRGTPDAILAEPKEKKLKLTVIDDKTHIAGPYFLQLYGYALILTDPNCLCTSKFDSDSEEVERLPFYPEIGDYDQIEIWCTLNPYLSNDGLRNNPLPPQLFSLSGLIANKGKAFAVMRTRKKILEVFYQPQLIRQSAQMKFHLRTGELYLPKSEEKFL